MRAFWRWCWWVIVALLSIGCAGKAHLGEAPSAPQGQPMLGAPAGEAPAAPAPEAEAPGAPADYETAGESKSSVQQPAMPRSATGGASAEGQPSREALEPEPRDRPGLGTAWGETRRSPTTTAPFIRDSANPFAIATLWYNDRVGADSMARASDYRRFQHGNAPALNGGLSITLRGEQGQELPGFYAGGKFYVVGEAGERYSIIIRNNTGFRYECVASVDGLDVIDGQPGGFTKRGYLIQPYGTLEIDGFRRSQDAVAAFRFSSVRGSYASRSGKGDRNVGVIGVAFFNEEGTRPQWTPGEVQRRHNADPFPGRYAEPPPQ